MFDLPIQRPVAEPVVDTVQPGAEQKDQVAEEIAREQERGPGFRAIERGIAIPQYHRAHLAHQQVREQRTRQQDGEEVHQADEELWWGGSKVMGSSL